MEDELTQPRLRELLRRDSARDVVEFRELEFEERATSTDADGRTVIEGYGVVFGDRNDWGEVFVPGAFRENLEQRQAEDKPIVMVWQHREPIGSWTAKENKRGLHAKGPISKTQLGDDVGILVRDGAINGLSVGYWPEDGYFAEPGETVSFETPIGTKTYKNDRWTFYITRARIYEISLVIAPSDDKARLQRKSLEAVERALPGLQNDSAWRDAAYSMALLMGGRGAAAFSDLPDLERRKIYARLARAYERHGKTPPAFDPEPEYQSVEFAHDERELFHDRYLQKQLDSIAAGVAGFGGALSPETRAKASDVAEALTEIAARRGEDDELRDLALSLRQTTHALTERTADR